MSSYQARKYIFKIFKEDMRATCERCSALVVNTQEQLQKLSPGFFIVKFEKVEVVI